ncbi:MAG: potassium/proton antiporter [Actinomycetota bacterium]|nr:potassium/proton antiporter [Actinomycetota bacterium]
MTDAQLILVAGLLMAAGLGAAKVADRVRVPGLLLFLGLGMLTGSEGIAGVEFDDAELTRTLGTIGLVLILFEGGLTAGWREIRPVLGTAISLAFIGTVATAVIAGVFATWVFDLDLLGGLIIGAAVASSDSAAIFAVLRGSSLRRNLARTLEGESGLNDPIAVLLVVGFIDWIQMPDYGIADMAVELSIKLSIGLVAGVLVGFGARAAFRRLDLPSPGLYPVASLATAALAFGLAEIAHGSGFLSVYIAALTLGTGPVPARGSTIAFHQGMSWTAQIALFFLLGLLVFPSGLGDIALEGLALSAVLIFVARPLAAVIATAFAPFDMKERLMLGWAGLRGAIPIWLATFPVIAEVQSAELIFNAIFFVVVTSTLIQGATFNPIAVRLGLTTNEPAVPPAVVETGTIRRLGGDVFTYVVQPTDAAVGALVRELGLPREALVNLIVRDAAAVPPRGSTEIQANDELHVLARREAIPAVVALTERWATGPLGEPTPPPLPLRGAPQVFTVRRRTAADGDPGHPDSIEGAVVAARLRVRRDEAGSLVALNDGRYAILGGGLVAVGGRTRMAEWAARRVRRRGLSPAERAWWEEVSGALNTPVPRQGGPEAAERPKASGGETAGESEQA